MNKVLLQCSEVHTVSSKDILKNYILMLCLILLLVFNVQHTGVRIVLVLAIIFLPIYLLWNRSLPQNFISGLVLTASVICFLLICVLVNSNTFTLSFSGAQGEIFAAFVSVSFVFYFALMVLTSWDFTNIDKLFKYVLIMFTFILLADAVVRYILEPNCFMNYFCRKEAKTVGFFSTTNVTGVNVATVLVTMIALKRVASHKIIFLLLHIILITTMARAAIISYAITVFLYLVINSHKFIRFPVFLFFIYIIVFVALKNPYDILNDGSLKSKFDFLFQTLEIAETATLTQLLFGFGASFNSVADILGVNGWSPHLPFLKAFFYFGIVGFFLYVFSMLICLALGGKRFIWPLLVNQVAALAGGPMYSTTLTFSLFFVYVYRKRLIGNER